MDTIIHVSRYDRLLEARRLIGQVNEEIFTKTIKKSERYMRKAYGEINWTELSAQSIVAFYNETLTNPKGLKTFNRGY
jgi:hypothetical protein